MCLILCSIPFYGRAQEGLILQSDDINYLGNRGSLISSSYGKASNQFYTSFKNRLGLLSDIRSIYAEGIIGIKDKHIVGMKAYSDQETSLFRKSKFGITYGINIDLSEKTTWTLATDINGINVYFGASQSTAGGSASTINGNLSSTLGHEKYEFAVALNQIPYQSLQPIDYRFEISSYLTSYFIYKFRFNQDFKWETGARILYHKNFTLFYADNHFTLQDRFGILASVSRNYNLGITYKYTSQKVSYLIMANYQGILVDNVAGQNQLSIGLMISA